MESKAGIFTDMAIEIKRIADNSKTKEVGDGVTVTVSEISKEDAEATGKSEGRYFTLECRDFFKNQDLKLKLSNLIAEGLKDITGYLKLLPKRVLAVGVGNIMMTADALGPECVNKILPIKKEGFNLYTLIPNVAGMTGVESFDMVTAVADKVRPELLIAIDSLAAGKTQRLSRSFQLSSAGLRPGEGIKNSRPALSYENLKIPVIAVGVPLVVYASRIVKDTLAAYGREMVVKNSGENNNYSSKLDDLIVTVKDVNIAVGECSDIIAGAINGLYS